MHFPTPSLQESERFCKENNMDMMEFADRYAESYMNIYFREERNIFLKRVGAGLVVVLALSFIYLCLK